MMVKFLLKLINKISLRNQFINKNLKSLYHLIGEPDENYIYGFLEKNQSPAVKELTDKIFEHMTQAATGATTGDWFVML